MLLVVGLADACGVSDDVVSTTGPSTTLTDVVVGDDGNLQRLGLILARICSVRRIR